MRASPELRKHSRLRRVAAGVPLDFAIMIPNDLAQHSSACQAVLMPPRGLICGANRKYAQRRLVKAGATGQSTATG